jgi:hypothetical protein
MISAGQMCYAAIRPCRKAGECPLPGDGWMRSNTAQILRTGEHLPSGIAVLDRSTTAKPLAAGATGICTSSCVVVFGWISLSRFSAP